MRTNLPLFCHLLQYVCGDNRKKKARYKIIKKHVVQAGDFGSRETLKDKWPLRCIFETIYMAIYALLNVVVPTLDMVPLNTCPNAHMVNPTLAGRGSRWNARLTEQ